MKIKAADVVRKFKRIQKVLQVASILQLSAHIWPKSANVRDVSTYDYVIVGGGTAGCVLANRLMEMPNMHVLLIEAGGNPPIESLYPGYFQYMKNTYVDWNMTSKREKYTKYHKKRVIDITQGKMLGGSSSLSYMAYEHGNSVDFALWATIANDSSWAYDAVLPIFKKSEKLIDKTLLKSPTDRAYYGTKGKLKIRRFYNKRNENYLQALAELGNDIVDNINSNNPLGFTHVLHTCDRNLRHSTAFSFLRPVKNNPRLHVMTHAIVNKIILDDANIAIGVRIVTQDKKTIHVRAYREVILTAGVFKTPQLLMLSGIGPKEHLEEKGINVLVDLPVGRNLQDHPTVLSVIRAGDKEPSPIPSNPHRLEMPIFDGKISVNQFKNYPDYEIRGIIVEDPETFLKFCAVSFSYTNELCNRLLKGTNDREIFMALNYLAYPRSRGEVHLKSRNIKDELEIKLGFYTNEEDLENHARYLMHFNDIFETTYFKQIEAKFVNPKLKACHAFEMTDLNYWKCYAMAMVTTSHYISGTCAMGSVVDSKLFVKGIKRLRVADASIIPTHISSPTAATVIMIAEKAADMIKVARYDKR